MSPPLSTLLMTPDKVLHQEGGAGSGSGLGREESYVIQGLVGRGFPFQDNSGLVAVGMGRGEIGIGAGANKGS